MDKDKEAFFRELLNDFKVEAAEHLQTISDVLLKLEKDPADPVRKDLIETVFRATHSMKGSARAVNQLQIERICMTLESVFNVLKKSSLTLSKSMFDAFFQASDMLATMLKEIDSKHKSISDNNIKQLTHQLNTLFNEGSRTPLTGSSGKPAAIAASGDKDEPEISPVTDTNGEQAAQTEVQPGNQESVPAAEGSSPAAIQESETVRVSVAKLYKMLHRAEAFIALKSELTHLSGEMHTLFGQISDCKKKFDAMRSAIAGREVSADAIEMTGDEEQLKRNQHEMTLLANNMDRLQRQTSRSVDELLLSIRQTMLQPFSVLFKVVPRIVRDLSAEYDKEVNLSMLGSEKEIDRRILEQMKDPLIHLIRNCIDHGIESRQERVKKNKPEVGSLTISVSSEPGQKILLEIADDGAGIDPEKLIASAVQSGAISRQDASDMDDSQICKLIFASGVSTSPFITDISGRGLGMAIVAEKIEALGGTIDVRSTPGKGTTFLISLPQTLSTFRGVLVKASDQLFLIPTSTVVRAVRVSVGDISTVEAKETIRIDGENIGLVSLASVLGLRRHHTGKKSDTLQGLVFQQAQRRLVFIVEEVLGEHEGVVKPLGVQLQHVMNISGATLLGDGKIVPVLNIPELLSASIGQGQTTGFSQAGDADKNKEEKPTQVLVAEDSITVRNMLRNYLDAAGFVVTTAVDGQEAFERMQDQSFDVVVSDVEMPRMNGFELTQKIRLSFGQVPVVLVTALESADDRRRGMEAGANAYIVKSSFEKGNLIEAIKRLI